MQIIGNIPDGKNLRMTRNTQVFVYNDAALTISSAQFASLMATPNSLAFGENDRDHFRRHR
jgi:hypothetical protein